MLSIDKLYSNIVEYKTKICLEEIKDLDIACKSILQRALKDELSVPMIKIQAVLDYTHERINIGNWKEVPTYYRKTMTVASYVKLLAFLKHNRESVPVVNVTEASVKDMFKMIDYGLLFGCPLTQEPKLLQNCASILNCTIDSTTEQVNNIINVVEYTKKETQILTNTNPNSAIDIIEIECPSMESFYTDYILKETPVILLNCINHWPAMTKWIDQDYFLKQAGFRTVPVEIGSKYTDSEWTQKLMTLGDFVKNHIYSSEGPTGYLAQYQLFDHIPELKNDISEPEYCFFSNTDAPIDINAWYGPKGTVSPMHHDPKRNLLAQVVGEKRIFLFSPNDSEFLYPHEGELLSNTAKVDPRSPDYELYPLFRQAKAQYCILKPGQILYIPPKWWHFVESLSISFSVSFWWE